MSLGEIVVGKLRATLAKTTVGALDRKLATRKARWSRLAAREGLPVPSAFELFRGVRGDYAVEDVVHAWADPTSETMKVPSRDLASWSLDKGIAGVFGDAREASVIYEANVPFEQTFADKWVDGGSFVSLGLEQEEVVVMPGRQGLTIPKAQATVIYGGQTYAYADRAALLKAWCARHL